jgi:hypothetical protein
MMMPVKAKENMAGETRRAPAGLLLSIALHIVLVAALLFAFSRPLSSDFITAGTGEGEPGGGAVEVGIADSSAILGFAKAETVSFAGDTDDPVNNTVLETARPEEAQPDEVLPDTSKKTSDPRALKTDRPVTSQQERIFDGKEHAGKSSADSIQMGRSYGSPRPAQFRRGIGIGTGGNFGTGTGAGGGSDYALRIQERLAQHYNPPPIESVSPGYVVLQLRIARDGTILSITGGRVTSSHFKQRAPVELINNAVERAVLGAGKVPPFPAGLLPGKDVGILEVWFLYPKQ